MENRRNTLIFVLIVATVMTYGRLCGADLTMWDDTKVLVDNPRVNPPTLAGVLWFWGHAHMEMYIPVTFSAWTLLAMALGMHGWVFHTANLLAHLLAVLTVFGLLRLLLRKAADERGADWGAAAGALLFALHPLQVEAVGWGTGLKDVMCGWLVMAAVWEYLRTASGCPRPRLHYGIATTAFVLAILSKPAGVVTPLLAGLLDLFLLQRSLRQIMRALWPWLVLSAAGGVVTKLAQPVAETIAPALWARPFIAGDTLAFYLYKLVFPVNLTIDYGRSPRAIMGHFWFHLTWLVPAAVGAAVWLWRPGRRWLGTASLLLVAGVLPVLGLISFHTEGWSTVCDHYFYLAMLGPALALAWLVSRHPRTELLAGVAGVLALLAVRSSFQTNYWQSSEALFTHAISVNKYDCRSHNNYGLVLLERARLAYGENHPGEGMDLLRQAEGEFRTAARLEPSRLYIQENFVRSLRLQGRDKDAIKHLSPLLPGSAPLSDRQREHYGPLYGVLGTMLMNQKRYQEAAAVFAEVVRQHPEDIDARLAVRAAKAAAAAAPQPTTQVIAPLATQPTTQAASN